MGGEQAAATMVEVQTAAAARRGIAVDTAQIEALRAKIVANFDGQMSAFATSARGLDDGVIDPRHTRAVLAEALAICREADARVPQRMQFGVARP